MRQELPYNNVTKIGDQAIKAVLPVMVSFRSETNNPRMPLKLYRRRPRRPPLRRVESDGVGVTSSILPIFIPERARARRAD